MHVIGLDLSLTATGVASSLGWLEKIGRDGITRLDLTDRVNAVDGIAQAAILLTAKADLVVVEQTAYTRSLVGKLENSALWWLVVRNLTRSGVPVAVVTPGQLKQYATGSGAAGKGAVVDAVARRWPDYATKGDDNLADAVVLAAMGADRYGHALAPMPAKHRQVLSRITWPEAVVSRVA